MASVCLSRSMRVACSRIDFSIGTVARSLCVLAVFGNTAEKALLPLLEQTARHDPSIEESDPSLPPFSLSLSLSLLFPFFFLFSLIFFTYTYTTTRVTDICHPSSRRTRVKAATCSRKWRADCRFDFFSLSLSLSLSFSLSASTRLA